MASGARRLSSRPRRGGSALDHQVEALGDDSNLVSTLSRALCEDVAQSGTYPMPQVPTEFGPKARRGHAPPDISRPRAREAPPASQPTARQVLKFNIGSNKFEV